MCGIAGIIYREGGGEHRIGRDMTAMLQAMKHRGPDSTGFALYRPESEGYVMHVKLAESNGHQDFDLADRLNRLGIEQRLEFLVEGHADLPQPLDLLQCAERSVFL